MSSHKKSKINIIFFGMLVFIPISILLGLFTTNHLLIFTTAILAIVPLARIMGYATKEIAIQTNPTAGGFLSATFGNAIELIIGLLALQQGLISTVQASMIGSILGNILLLIGLSIFAGGLRYKYQKFNNETIAVSSTMLIIVVAGLSIPTVYSFLTPETSQSTIQFLSTAVAGVMALIYILGLIFSFRTHKDLYDASDDIRATQEKPTISIRFAAVMLFISIIVVSFVSDFLVESIKDVALTIGITQTFIGIVFIGIITNIAENANAVHFALQNRLDVSIEIGLSSAIQIALFVVPILTFISLVFGYGFTLVFSLFEVLALMLAVLIVNYLSADGKCNWLEGAQLISVYFIIAIAFFFI